MFRVEGTVFDQPVAFFFSLLFLFLYLFRFSFIYLKLCDTFGSSKKDKPSISSYRYRQHDICLGYSSFIRFSFSLSLLFLFLPLYLSLPPWYIDRFFLPSFFQFFLYSRQTRYLFYYFFYLIGIIIIIRKRRKKI